jgi:lysophospholipid hydrolase
MSLSGYLPPLCDNGNMLLDGGYLNNLPTDVMKSLGARTIIAVDVGSNEKTLDVNYGDSLSGWWVMLMRMNPMAGLVGPDVGGIPQLAEIQSKLAYVSCVRQLEEAKTVEGVLYMRPPVFEYGTLEFGKYEEIYLAGYNYAMEMIEGWERDGVMEDAFGIGQGRRKKGKLSRRASI